MSPARSQPRARGQGPGFHLSLLGSYAALAIGLTWPLATHLDTHVIRAKWFYDSMVNIMILGSRIDALADQGPIGLFENYFCAPLHNTIVYNENHLALSLLYAPFYLLSDDPLLAYNLLLLLGFALSGYFTALLVHELSGSWLAGFVSGVGFAFSPYVFFELGRIQLVSTQWIPLCFYALHRAFESNQRRYIALLATAFVLQVGSCLYYAIFLLLFLPLVALYLAFAHRRREPRFWAGLLGAGAVVAVLVGLMIHPYLVERDKFPLTRSRARVEAYSGRFEHFTSVYKENKTLTFLRDDATGGSEPIAFPGFVLLGLALLALLLPALGQLRAGPAGRLGLALGFAVWSAAAALALGVTLWSRTCLWGLLVLSLTALAWRLRSRAQILPSHTAMYTVVVLLAVALFLGPKAWELDGGGSIRGLYYYLYEYVPTFNGIRYVSRLAVVVMLGLAVLAGMGLAHALSLLPGAGPRRATFALLLCLMLAELLNAPNTLAQLPNKAGLSETYRWLQQRPGPEPIAVLPAYPKGFFGARNDYLTLFHKRRTINGKSSWMPPVTHMWINESRFFPNPSATRMLQTLGAKYLVVHGAELRPHRRQAVLEFLEAAKDRYIERYRSGSDRIYELGDADKVPGVGLLPTPARPDGLRRLHPWTMKLRASRTRGWARRAVDERPKTKWATRRHQRSGDWFEFELQQVEKVAAIEFSDFDEPFDAAVSYRVEVAQELTDYRVVVEQPVARIYRDQVYNAKAFVHRIVLPKPEPAKRVRIKIVDPVIGRWWTIHEASVWVED